MGDGQWGIGDGTVQASHIFSFFGVNLCKLSEEFTNDFKKGQHKKNNGDSNE